MKDNAGSRKIQGAYKQTEAFLKRLCAVVSDRIDSISMRQTAAFAAILLVLSLLPLLLLGKYNVMCIDDYNYGLKVHDTWMTTGSFLQSVRAAWEHSMSYYQNWTGTYAASFIMALCPMNFRYETAFLVPVIMIGLLTASSFVFGKHILTRWFDCDRASAVFVMCMLLFLYYQVMESPFEGLYWYNGATNYILTHSVWFFTLTLILTGFWTKKRRMEVLCCIFAAVLSVIACGGNLITGLQAVIVMASLLLYAIIKNRGKIYLACVPFLTGGIGFLFNTMSPGSANRSMIDADLGYGAVKSVLLSFYHAVVYMIQWTPAVVIIGWLMLLPVLWKAVKKSGKKYSHPVFMTLGAYCLISAMFTPMLYALGYPGLARVDNIIQFVYYLCAVFVTAYWFGYFSHREQQSGQKAAAAIKNAGEAFGSFLEKTRGRMTIVCLLLVLVIWAFTANKNTYASISALRSLVNGDAQVYYAEAMERHGQYTDETVTDVVIKPYSRRPALFDFEDLNEDPEYWLNQAVRNYYHKTSVRLLEEQ